MNMNIIAAVGECNEIGKYNKLIWNLPQDLRFFKEMTMEKNVIMGSNTFFSLQNKLHGRNMIVISSKKLDDYYDVICYHDILDALEVYQKEEIFVIGGQSIYEQCLPFTDTMYLTEVQAHDYDADAYFPFFDKNEWNITNLDYGIDNQIGYARKKYVRKKV